VRRTDAVELARPVVVAAARVLGASPDDAWERFAGPSSRRSVGQPPPEVTLVRLAVAIALYEQGLPFMTATGAAGSRRRQSDGVTSTAASITARLMATAPAVLSAARNAARLAVREVLPPTIEATRAALRALLVQVHASGITSEEFATQFNRRGSAARRRVARALVGTGHTRRNVADAMGWTTQAIDHWVGDRRGTTASPQGKSTGRPRKVKAPDEARRHRAC